MSSQKKATQRRADDKTEILANQTAQKTEQKLAKLNVKLQEQMQMILNLEEANRQILIEINTLKAQTRPVCAAKSNVHRGVTELEDALQFANIEVAQAIGWPQP